MTSVGVSLTDARIALEAALDAGGLPVMPHAGALAAAPGAMVAAADPWLVPVPNLERLDRMSRWRILLVAGSADLEGILDQLGTMIAGALQALRAADIATDRVPISGPRRLPQENAMYLVVELVALVPVTLATNPVPTP